jgi:hypothetical protein
VQLDRIAELLGCWQCNHDDDYNDIDSERDIDVD